MVAEKNGTIRFYDLLAQQAILSLESEQMPLMSAHWCLKNTFKVGAVAGNDWLIWDITRSRYFLSIFIYYLPKNQSLLLNDPLTYSCIPGPHCKAKIRLSYKRARVNGLLHNSHGFYRFTLRVTERIMQRRSFIEGVCVSVCVCVCVCMCTCAHTVMSDSLRPHKTVAQQAPLSMEFSKQECQSTLPFPTPGDLLILGIKTESLASPSSLGKT